MDSMVGITAPVLTPYKDNGEINFEEYKKLNKYILKSGVQGLFVGGTTGEFINLSINERKNLLLATKECSDKNTQIMFNVTSMNMDEITDLIDFAEQNNIKNISITAPYYHKYDELSLINYFKHISSLAKDLNVFLYNIPVMTNNSITAHVLKSVVESSNNIKGIKDSSMDFMTFLNYQAVSDEKFKLLIGNDAQILTSLMAGGNGGVVAIASVFPKLTANIYSKFEAGDIEGAKKDQLKVMALREIFRSVKPIMSHKKALEFTGFKMGPARLPFRDLNEQESKEVYDCIKKLGLLDI